MKAYKLNNKNNNNSLKLMSATSMAALLTGCFDIGGAPYVYYTGTDGDDIMLGEADVVAHFESSPGADTMTALRRGASVNYSKSDEAIVVTLDGSIGKGGHAEGDVYNNINGIEGSLFADKIVGNSSKNRINGRDGDDEIDGGAGDDTLSGDGGNDVLIGGYGDDILWGGEGDDKLYGNDGDDTLNGGSGADVLDGGAGFDIVSISGSYESVTINFATGENSGGSVTGDSYISIEGMIGSGVDDHLTGDDADNFIDGFYGNDVIYGLGGNDELLGQQGDDIIFGGTGNDRIAGGRGNDILHGEAGNDLIFANVRSSSISSHAEVNGGAGIDSLNEQISVHFYNGNSGLNRTDVFKVEFIIQKDDHKIVFNHGENLEYVDSGHDLEQKINVNILNSIEFINLMPENGGSADEVIDMKQIWEELAVAEQAKFADEAGFLSWLGDDTGYNYEGL